MTTCACTFRSLLLLLACVPAIGAAAVYTVSNTNDSGDGSLRKAILDANGSPGFDEIHFAIPGDAVHTIAVLSTLPGFADPVLVDGYTQPGALPNDATIGSGAVIRIEITPAPTFAGGGLDFLVGSAGSSVRGLAVYGFNGVQIELSLGCTDCIVAGNFIGTDASGTTGYPGSPGTRVGLAISGARARIGGTGLADRNLVAGLSNTGIGIGADAVIVQGNLVGTDRTGEAALGAYDGIQIGALGGGDAPAGVLIGGPGAGNVISGNASNGIVVKSGTGHSIVTNLIGLGAGQLAILPNAAAGILVSGGSLSNIGADTGGLGNWIFGNGGGGIRMTGTDETAPQGWFLIRNAIAGNGGLGIDLGLEGSTPNDPLDADVGANSLQNFPVLSSVTNDGTETHVRGHLQSAPDGVYRIDFYTDGVCEPGGATYLGVTPAFTDAAGNADFELIATGVIDTGFITATASRSEDLATSELSPCRPASDLIFADGFDG